MISIEFFPPRSDTASEKLMERAVLLKDRINPEFFSVTFGAGGSTQESTMHTVIELQEKTKIPTAAHISCINTSPEAISKLLNKYIDNNINRLVVLRGDLPSGMGKYRNDGFTHAAHLVEFIRKTTGDHFHISVAAYPEYHPDSKTPENDIAYFIEKVKLGSNQAITQYFYNAEAYFYFVDRVHAAGIDIPIIPGIMPITNAQGIIKFSTMCGADIPRWIRLNLERFQDDTESLKAFGQDIVVKLCQNLLDQGAPQPHFYSLNQAKPVIEIYNKLKS
ncbi:MAG: methylenetetrahydrofolate reductase (NADPH) [Francisellaceae bacterium]|jgi:methylenetetrahydrofolate reductase (NADPH)